jgi:Carboxypeptidase regulatory-like domain/TonB-dependent Receptor Plug Domain
MPAASPATVFVVHGIVQDAKHAPVTGALVELLGPSGMPTAQARSDARGRFELPPLPPGGYRVRISQPAFATQTIVLDLGPATVPLVTTLEESVEEVRVSGNRTPPGQTGASVSVLSHRDIQDLPGGDAQSLSQVVLTQPGFTPDSFGPDGLFHIRGAETGVLYVVDGVPIPGDVAGQFTDILPAPIIQKVNLISGGQPVEFGPNAGGVFDITTREGAGKPEGAVQMVYGTYQKAQPSAWYSQAFGKLDVFVAGTLLSTQRGLDPPAATPILNDAELGGNAFTRVDYRPNSHDRIELIARYSEQHFQIPIDPTLLPLSDAPAGATRGPDSYGNLPAPFVPYNASPTEVERDLFVTAAYSHAFPGTVSVQVAPYVRYFYGNLDCDPDATLGPTADPGSVCSSIIRSMTHEGQNTTYAWRVGDAQRWKAGVVLDAAESVVDYSLFTRSNDPVQSPVGGPYAPETNSGQDNTNILSGGAFLQDEITVGGLKVFPGLRADFQNANYLGASQPNLLLGGPSARLGFSYALSTSLLLHGFVGYLWQPPNAVDASVAARALVPGLIGQPLPTNLEAERDESAEVGLTYRIPHRFDVGLTGYGRFSQDTIDVQTVGATDLIEDYNYNRGRAVGAELASHATVNNFLRGFGNVSWNIAQGQGIGSEQYLFTPAQVAYPGWQILDHVQEWTVNVGADLHDEAQTSHLAVSFQYASGLRTGPDNNETVPGYTLWNATLRHRFDLGRYLRPELAIDVFNALDTVYAIRIGNGFVGNAYGPLRQVNGRLTIPFGG